MSRYPATTAAPALRPGPSIKHAGTPWELGLAETQQTLVLNRLRGRIAVQVDGQIKTGRDVVIGAMLGADEFGFATAPLVVEGCIMMRKCHLNTCPVGVATQDPVLRKKFQGKPEHVVNFFFFVAEEAREIMAQLGVRSIDELIGRSDLLEMKQRHRSLEGEGAGFLADIPSTADRRRAWRATKCEEQDHGLEGRARSPLIAAGAGRRWSAARRSRSTCRYATSTALSAPCCRGEVARRYGHAGLPDDTIRIKFAGTAGQSFGAFLARGITLELIGESNDYFGKGLSRRAHQRACRRPNSRLVSARTSSSAIPCCTARLPAKAISPASRASVSPCATPARSRWWKGWATTAANT